MWSTATGDAGKEEESVVVGGGDHLLPVEVMMMTMMARMMMIKIIRLPALGGGDHRVLHAGKQQVRARHSFAWVPCATVLVLGTWYLVLGTLRNQEYWKETGGNERRGRVDTC